MYFESYDSMIDSVMFSKERTDQTGNWRDSENSSEYYYDDATGYRIYKPEDEDEDEREED
jgi:hypothetical protein